MRLINDGAKCCGIKHIFGLSPHPNLYVSELYSDDFPYESSEDSDGFSEYQRPGEDFYTSYRDREQGGDRLKVFLEYLDEMRPHGLCQITLNLGVPGERECDHQRAWIPVLKANGFKRVITSMNSNSGNKIAVYMRKSGD